MATLTNSKAPGSNGLPIELHKQFGDILIPELLTAITDAKDRGSLQPFM